MRTKKAWRNKIDQSEL